MVVCVCGRTVSPSIYICSGSLSMTRLLFRLRHSVLTLSYQPSLTVPSLHISHSLSLTSINLSKLHRTVPPVSTHGLSAGVFFARGSSMQPTTVLFYLRNGECRHASIQVYVYTTRFCNFRCKLQYKCFIVHSFSLKRLSCLSI